MNTEQLLELIITPTHKYMGGNYQSDSADLLSLSTAAIESDCGYYIKQVNGPALGIWQMEPATHYDIWDNCDALNNPKFLQVIYKLDVSINPSNYDDDTEAHNCLIHSNGYACLMARLKYSMDSKALPEITGDRILDVHNFYHYYKRIYNTELGKSTFAKWQVKMEKHRVFEVFYNLRGY